MQLWVPEGGGCFFCSTPTQAPGPAAAHGLSGISDQAPCVTETKGLHGWGCFWRAVVGSTAAVGRTRTVPGAPVAPRKDSWTLQNCPAPHRQPPAAPVSRGHSLLLLSGHRLHHGERANHSQAHTVLHISEACIPAGCAIIYVVVSRGQYFFFL